MEARKLKTVDDLLTWQGDERVELIDVMLLQRAGVPHYWIISPEDRTLIAYALEGGSYHVCMTIDPSDRGAHGKARIPPFDAVEIDLDYLFGGDT
jgi:hypothetical protein